MHGLLRKSCNSLQTILPSIIISFIVCYVIFNLNMWVEHVRTVTVKQALETRLDQLYAFKVNPLEPEMANDLVNGTLVTKPKKKKTKKKGRLKKTNINSTLEYRKESDLLLDKANIIKLDKLDAVPKCLHWNLTQMPPYSIICHESQRNPAEEKILTMFTTMASSPKNFQIMNNTLHLWSQLGSEVARILFVSSTENQEVLIREACTTGNWTVMVAPLCHGIGVPVLKAMAMAAEQMSSSLYYMYANGDIVFDQSLLDTLNFLQSKLSTVRLKRQFLIGRRTNLKLNSSQQIHHFEELDHLVAKSGKDGWVAAVDYFLSSRGGLKWQELPKVVVARVAYDNWMVMNAVRKKLAVIDVSETVRSVHQYTGNYYASHHTAGSQINWGVLGKFDFTRGLISCAPYKTLRTNQSSTIGLFKRLKYKCCGPGGWARRSVLRSFQDEKVMQVVDFTKN